MTGSERAAPVTADTEAPGTVAADTVPAPPAAEQSRVERAAAQADPRSTLARLLDTGAGRNVGLVAVLVVLCVIGVATAGTFATTGNLLTILTSASIIGVMRRFAFSAAWNSCRALAICSASV